MASLQLRVHMVSLQLHVHIVIQFGVVELYYLMCKMPLIGQ